MHNEKNNKILWFVAKEPEETEKRVHYQPQVLADKMDGSCRIDCGRSQQHRIATWHRVTYHSYKEKWKSSAVEWYNRRDPAQKSIAKQKQVTSQNLHYINIVVTGAPLNNCLAKKVIKQYFL